MNTTRPAWATEPTTVRRVAAAPRCGCGQDLDICTGHHCPRCGHTLRERVLTTAA